MPQIYTKKKGKHQFQPDPSKYLYNIDTLWLNINAENYQKVMDDGFRDILSNGRDTYYDGLETEKISVKLIGYDNDVLFEVRGGQAPQYQYSIRNEDIAIYFSKNEKLDNSMPMKIQINQFILWEKGVVASYLESLEILYQLGFIYDKAKINRIDFSVHSDQWHWNLKDLETFKYPQNFAKDNFPNFYKLNPLTGDFETVNYGNRAYLQLRIYNKSKEIEVNQKYHFKELYEKKGLNPDKVWNIEIEVRNEYLKELKDVFYENKIFDDFDQCLSTGGLNQLWSFLINSYDHKSAHWNLIKKGGKEFEKVDTYIKRISDVDWSTEREVAQIRGRLQKFLITTHDNDIDKAIEIFKRKCREYEKNKKRDFTEEVKKKKQSYNNEHINYYI